MKRFQSIHKRAATLCAVVFGLGLVLQSPVAFAGGLDFGFVFGQHGLSFGHHNQRHRRYTRYDRRAPYRYGYSHHFGHYGPHEYYRPSRHHHRGHHRKYANPGWRSWHKQH